MNITWYGSRCVRIEAKEGSILAEPFDSKETGLRGPVIKDDLVLVSEPDPAKSVKEKIGEGSFAITGPGEYERKGIAVRGILGYADSQNGKELGLATIYAITAEGVVLCHLGALGQATLTDEQLEAIGDPDILFIPVGGQSALDAKVAAEMCNQIEPKVIIPVQFAIPNASYVADKLDKFIKEIGLTPEYVDKLHINTKQLPADQTKLIVLKT